MHNIDLILTITGGLAAALVFGYLTERLRLSPIVGYLLGGIVIGPHTPPGSSPTGTWPNSSPRSASSCSCSGSGSTST